MLLLWQSIEHPLAILTCFLIDQVTIKTLYKAELKLIICGDINIDYIKDNDTKRQRYAVLLTYNLSAMVHFPTRSQGYSSTAIDNIFIDSYKFINYTASPLHNGLTDHPSSCHNKHTQKYTHTHTHTHTYVPWVHNFITETAQCGTGHNYTNINSFYSVRYNNSFMKKCYGLALHIKKFIYRVKAVCI